MALGVTGPILRAAGLPWDLRKSEPYCGYETTTSTCPPRTTATVRRGTWSRMDEMGESLKIIEQCLDRLDRPGPTTTR